MKAVLLSGNWNSNAQHLRKRSFVLHLFSGKSGTDRSPYCFRVPKAATATTRMKQQQQQ
jgi:hypothetical protein